MPTRPTQFGRIHAPEEAWLAQPPPGIGWAPLWNAFKRIAAGASPTEKEALFAGTARRVYRLE